MMKAVIFDMDGVIVDSEPIHFESDKMTMKHYGKEISDEELNNYVGISNPEMWTDFKEKYRLSATLEEILEKQISFKKILIGSKRLEPIDGIRELLCKLKSGAIKIGLASSSSRELIELILNNIGIKESFEVIISAEDVQKSKPAPDIFLAASERLGLDPSTCLVIEDSRHGVKASKLAGMKCIGFRNPHSGSQDLSSADAVVCLMSEIYPLMNSMNFTDS